MQRIAIPGIQRGEFAAKLMQAFDLIFERRQRVRQAPHLDFQPLKTTGKSQRIGNEEGQLESTHPLSTRSRGSQSPSTPDASSRRRIQ